jgi:hypothetical protein
MPWADGARQRVANPPPATTPKGARRFSVLKRGNSAVLTMESEPIRKGCNKIAQMRKRKSTIAAILAANRN